SPKACPGRAAPWRWRAAEDRRSCAALPRRRADRALRRRGVDLEADEPLGRRLRQFGRDALDIGERGLPRRLDAFLGALDLLGQLLAQRVLRRRGLGLRLVARFAQQRLRFLAALGDRGLIGGERLLGVGLERRRLLEIA